MEETAMTAITSALTTVLGYVGTILDTITGNPILVVLLAGGTFLPLAIGVFRRIKRASH